MVRCSDWLDLSSRFSEDHQADEIEKGRSSNASRDDDPSFGNLQTPGEKQRANTCKTEDETDTAGDETDSEAWAEPSWIAAARKQRRRSEKQKRKRAQQQPTSVAKPHEI